MNYKREYLGGRATAVISSSHGFGTDALLLADFASPKSGDICCDLGTGCGIIPLYWCRDSSPVRIDAVDIMQAACEQALEGVRLSGVGDIISVHNADLRSLKGILPFGAYSLVTMNPPYTAAGAGIESADSAALTARHEVACSLEDVARSASGLLRFGGRLCICQRPARLADAMCAMRSAGIEPKRLRFAVKNPDSAPWLFLLEGRRGGKPGMTVLPPLVTGDGIGGDSDEIKRILGSYTDGKAVNTDAR